MVKLGPQGPFVPGMALKRVSRPEKGGALVATGKRPSESWPSAESSGPPGEAEGFGGLVGNVFGPLGTAFSPARSLGRGQGGGQVWAARFKSAP